MKKQILIIGIIILMMICVGFLSGCINTQNPPSQQEPVTLTDINITSDEFYEEMLAENGSIYLVTDVSRLFWQWHPDPVNITWGIGQHILIFDNESKIEEIETQSLHEHSLHERVLIYGAFENKTFLCPTSKTTNPNWTNCTYKVFNLEDVSKINFSTVEYPTNITIDEEIEIIQNITNPFDQPITLVLTISSLDSTYVSINNRNITEATVSINYTFYPNETKTFKWNLKPIYSSFEDIDILIFGKNEDKKVWITDSCRFDII
jgi:spore coat protein U-like protein